MLTYIEYDLRDDDLELFARLGIQRLELMLARYADFNRLHPDQGADPS